MNMVKSLLLGSVAGLAAVAGAQAADLPVKAKAVEYVKVCSAYGAGFYYIPGTDTCLKIDGYARFDTYLNAVGTFNPNISSVAGTGFNGPGAGGAAYPMADDDDSSYLTRARAVMGMDARTQTDYGTLRSYIRFGMNWDSQTSAGGGSNIGFYFERAFIQFAGFTFGYTQSFFDTGISYSYSTLYAGSNQWTTALAYTAQFGNGFSATIALEDAANRITGVQASAVGAYSPTAGLSYTNYQSGQEFPDIVGNLRIDQAWGSAQLSAAAHQVGALTPTYAGTGTSFLGQNSSDTWGWAIGGAVEIKLPVIAPGDSLYIQANYADGALSYVGLSGTSQGRGVALGSIDPATTIGFSSGAFYTLADAVWNQTTLSYDTVSAWSIQGQFRHFWTPGFRSAIFGGYTDVSVPTNTVGATDVNIWQVGVNSIWSPVKNLDLGVEVLYSKVDGDAILGNYATGATAATGGATAVLGGSTDVWSGGFRAQRNF
ncbi:polymerase [Azorhizobium oxalatiphilum]|uniref:Porin n=1 Tax=Azorhizobium oxalatiphilum TaxID=980631 RepID=A0A917F8E3_9HYPH|nr:porin [Azorhizobium oxalatiphilum]GGF55281.1 polymerase [Azorhizobium oxalatiphilum]